MNTRSDIVPEEAIKLLPEWLRTICREERVSLNKLLEQMQRWLRQRSWRDSDMVSESLLKRIRLGKEKAAARSGKKVCGLWEFLESQPNYLRHRDKHPTAATPPPPALGNHSLANSLVEFFNDGSSRYHSHYLPLLQVQIVGRFVMYREKRMHVLGKESPPLIQASTIEITAVEDYLEIKEVQDFARSKYGPAVKQTTTGVLAPFEVFGIGLMRQQERSSFKCMVIEFIPTIFEKVDVEAPYFRGKIVETDGWDFFNRPGTENFVCERSLGNDKHGIYPISKIDKNVLKYLFGSTTQSKRGSKAG